MSIRIKMAAGLCCALLLASGCQTVNHSSTPIVGDSMSMGPGCGSAEAYDAGCMPDGCTDPGYCMDGEVVGCAGADCDGRCGGRCGLARLRMRMAGMRHGNGPLANAIQCTHNRCANGQCGGVAGPEMGAVTYPYYTLRGPRDFLMQNPPPLGP